MEKEKEIKILAENIIELNCGNNKFEKANN